MISESSQRHLECGICLMNYTKNDKKPYNICKLQHTVCQKCMKDMKGKKCPFCKCKVHESELAVNQKLMEIVSIY